MINKEKNKKINEEINKKINEEINKKINEEINKEINKDNKVKNYEEKYELMNELGRGSFGKVFKAKVKGEDIYVAIKIIDKGKIKTALRSEYDKQDVEQ